MKKNNAGFSLVELLAVIVILGLLMSIAIPNITKYVTESRRDTLIDTINAYAEALASEIANRKYSFYTTNTVYAVPIECLSIEKGGDDPFGEWYQANKNYWAYVLVYIDDNYNYTYGFTFKDTGGYGLQPASIEYLNSHPEEVTTGLTLWKPMNDFRNFKQAGWLDRGLDIDIYTTQIKVLTSASEGEEGDGKTTCTLRQKGSNYDDVEEVKVDVTPPTCGTTEGDSTTWATGTRTIKQQCLDDESGCYVDYHTTTFTTSKSIKTSSIAISDWAENQTSCTCNVYLDNQIPYTLMVSVSNKSSQVKSAVVDCDSDDLYLTTDRTCTISVTCYTKSGCSVTTSLTTKTYSGIDWSNVLVYAEKSDGTVVCDWTTRSSCSTSGATTLKYKSLNTLGVYSDGILTYNIEWEYLDE